MYKHLIAIFITFSLTLFFVGCVGQPKVPETKGKVDNSGTLWAENTNVDADENDNVDVSDLDKDVKSGDGTSTEQMVARIAFPEMEYNALERNGKGTIEGSIYLQDAYGTKIYGAKTRLYLNPVTSYSKQWYKKSYIDGQKMSKPDPRLFNYLRFTSSDENGVFAFYGVPSGRYYIIGTVECGSQCGYGANRKIRIATEVLISGNQILDQDVTKGI